MILESLSLEKKESLGSRLSRNNRLLRAAELELAQANKRLADLRDDEPSFPNKHLFNLAIPQVESDVAILENRIIFLGKEEKLLREPNISDIQYRKKLTKEFPKLLLKKLGDSNLKFHGTPLINSLSVLESERLVSSPELGLGRTSLDVSGQVSATNPDSVVLSIKDYININDAFLPLGCLFVLDVESDGRDSIPSVELAKDGSKLKAILCSTEVLPIIKRALSSLGYPDDLAFEYFEFLEK
jgi:hypothetical protein